MALVRLAKPVVMAAYNKRSVGCYTKGTASAASVFEVPRSLMIRSIPRGASRPDRKGQIEALLDQTTSSELDRLIVRPKS